MQKSKTETLIQKYLSHQLNEQEFKELKQWIEEDASHKEIFVKLLSLRHVNNQLNLLQQFDKEASWEAIQKRCKQPHSIRYRVAIYSSAAAIAVIIGIASILYFRFLSVRLNRLKNKLLANYLRNRGNDLATVRNSAFCVAILSNNSFICKYNIFFRKYELSVAIL
ncbi:hypothetical protein GAY76_19670 [Phocaeicola vulgatus]|uniref:Anti-sigma factor n=1 Tax=Phocaeicola vulgatus TaxID=821 RepID=A0A7J5RPM2_PHOVU|nr:hypothetical protein GAY76_19670 [Phocaeicola vulgatus]